MKYSTLRVSEHCYYETLSYCQIEFLLAFTFCSIKYVSKRKIEFRNEISDSMEVVVFILPYLYHVCYLRVSLVEVFRTARVPSATLASNLIYLQCPAIHCLPVRMCGSCQDSDLCLIKFI